MSFDRYPPSSNPTHYEHLQQSLLSDISQGGYGGKPHGGNFTALLSGDAELAIAVLEALIQELDLGDEGFSASAAEVAELLYWEDEEDKDRFIRRHTSAAGGGDKIRHQGVPTSSAQDLREFFADVEAKRNRQKLIPRLGATAVDPFNETV